MNTSILTLKDKQKRFWEHDLNSVTGLPHSPATNCEPFRSGVTKVIQKPGCYKSLHI